MRRAVAGELDLAKRFGITLGGRRTDGRQAGHAMIGKGKRGSILQDEINRWSFASTCSSVIMTFASCCSLVFVSSLRFLLPVGSFPTDVGDARCSSLSIQLSAFWTCSLSRSPFVSFFSFSSSSSNGHDSTAAWARVHRLSLVRIRGPILFDAWLWLGYGESGFSDHLSMC